jgi:pimeloyl-ACP methyl ester carboxylesterase
MTAGPDAGARRRHDPPGPRPGLVSYTVLPGAGSAGLVWAPAAARLAGAVVLPLPDEPDVTAMAAALAGRVGQRPGRRILVGSSLGALVAIEIARSVRVSALVLIAAGFGITVGRPILRRIAASPPGLLAALARGLVADPADRASVDLITRDFEARGQPLLLRHMRVLAAHRPQPLAAPPPTLVLCGARDPGVPLAGHAELALRCAGLLVPIAGAGHLPYLERPEETVRWIRAASSPNVPCSPAVSLTAPMEATPS